MQVDTVSLAAVQEAARTLEGVAVRTPLVELPTLSARVGAPVLLKCEQLQPVGAFKIRGAYYAISRLAGEQRLPGVVTHSSGNHGQAVAFAARAFGLRAVVVMPSSAPSIKVEGVRKHGGEVVLAGQVRSPEQYRRAEEIAAEQGLALIPPFDHPEVIAGQGTVGLEILEQRPDVDLIVAPVGGGGLISGIAVAVAGLRPEVAVVGAEPVGAPKLSAALRAGAPTALDRTESIADGLLTRSVGALAFETMRDVVHLAIQVPEDDIAAAVRLLHREAGLVVEPSGAVAAAALLRGSLPALPGGRAAPRSIVGVISGGNVDAGLFQQLVA